jgi:decaprenylphospho-beta-D-erythro-pentofuranosid-2-ulose 2-reductase
MKISGLKCLVIGASSGIGAELARQLGGHGCPVALVSRRENELDTIVEDINRIAGRSLAKSYIADVTEFQSAPGLIRTIIDDFGTLDIVVYSAGIMPKLDKDEYDFCKDKSIVDVNILGAISWLNPIAERFSRTKSGTIVGIGSVAGDRGRPAVPVYNSSKAFLETYLEALRNRLGKDGVQVVTIKPGFINTPMTEGIKIPFRGASVENTASEIIAAIESGTGVYYTPKFWRWIMLAVKLIPSPIMQRLKF